MERPDDETWAWVEGVVGKAVLLFHFAHDHGYSRLWRLESQNGKAWLKMHAYPHKWAGEVHALTRWAPELGRTPSVLAYRTDPEAVLLSEVAGVPAELLGLGGAEEERMWREAGEWLAHLHRRENDWLGNVRTDGTPQDRPVFDAETFVRANWESTLAKGKTSGLYDAAEIDYTEGAVRAGLPSLAGEKARAVHRDYTPRNWMARPDGGLEAVIDFEHARWDVRAADLNRPWDYEFLRNSRLRDAFYEGYGGLDEKLGAQIETIRTMLAFNSILWATGVGDGAFAQRYREALHRMMGH